MKYKNIVFDFGNVIGKFDGRYMLEQFCSSKKDCDLLYPLIATVNVSNLRNAGLPLCR
mgnify:CR=1 FL=1